MNSTEREILRLAGYGNPFHNFWFFMVMWCAAIGCIWFLIGALFK